MDTVYKKEILSLASKTSQLLDKTSKSIVSNYYCLINIKGVGNNERFIH